MQWYLISKLSVCLVLFWVNNIAHAEDMRFSLPESPPLITSQHSGPLVDLIREMEKENHNGHFVVDGPFPFARSINNVVSGVSDVHMPLLWNSEVKAAPQGFIYSSEPVFQVQFVLYVRRPDANQPALTLEKLNLKAMQIETDRAHTSLFPFPVSPATSIEGALRKVESGRSDGFLFAMRPTDNVLRQLGFKNIQRIPFRKFYSHAIFQDSEKGRRMEALFSRLLKATKQSGAWKRAMGIFADQTFVDFAP